MTHKRHTHIIDLQHLLARTHFNSERLSPHVLLFPEEALVIWTHTHTQSLHTAVC